MKNQYQIMQWVQTGHVRRIGHWEPIQNGEYTNKRKAIAGMRELEKQLDWRDLAVLDNQQNIIQHGKPDANKVYSVRYTPSNIDY